MDPLSISVSCVSLVSAITKVSWSVTVFVREVRDARGDLDLISRELHSLSTVLQLLGDDFAKPSNSTLPPTLITHLGEILKNCDVVIKGIETSLAKHKSSRIGVGGHWTLGGGKDDMAKFRTSLETHKSALELALEMVTINITRDVKKDTEAIREDTAVIPDIKNDTSQILQILEEIARLKARLPADAAQSGPNLMLQRFLDDTTSYAETVINESLEEDPEFSDSSPVTKVGHTMYASPDKELEMLQLKQSEPREELNQSTLSPNSTQSRTNSGTTAPPTANEHQSGDFPPTDKTMIGPTTRDEFLRLVERRNWKFFSWQHDVLYPGADIMSGPPGTRSEGKTHRYTALACTPSELAKTDFKFRQQTLQPPRDTMLLIGVYYAGEYGDPGPRIGTTLESITQSLSHMDGMISSSSDRPWWHTVVVCIMRQFTMSDFGHEEFLLGKWGLQLFCDKDSAECGVPPQSITNSTHKLYAHMWEHTDQNTNFTWDRKGQPNRPKASNTPLQLIYVNYPKGFKDSDGLGDEQHLQPFVHMLNAQSCVSIMAGDKVETETVFAAWRAVQNTDPTENESGISVYGGRFYSKSGSVPTRIYSQRAGLNFRAEKRSGWTRFNNIIPFG